MSRAKWTAKALRALVGKTIQWERTLDRNRGSYTVHRGVVQEVSGKNILIDGDWKWWPDLENIKVLPDSPPVPNSSSLL